MIKFRTVVFFVVSARSVTVDFLAAGALPFPAQIRLARAKIMFITGFTHDTAVGTSASLDIVFYRAITYFS